MVSAIPDPYEIPRFDVDHDAELAALYHEHVAGHTCPECGAELELVPTRDCAEVVCTECLYFRTVVWE